MSVARIDLGGRPMRIQSQVRGVPSREEPYLARDRVEVVIVGAGASEDE